MVSSGLNPAATSTDTIAIAAPEQTLTQVETRAQVEIPTLESMIVTKAQASGVDPKLARKIAFCESTLRQFDKNGEVLRGLHNPDDVGLFQINEEYHKQKSEELGYDIHTTEGNIDYAMWLIKNEGERHWKWSQPCWDPE